MAGRHSKRERNALVPVESDESIDHESNTHGRFAGPQGSVYGDHDRKEMDGMRRNSSEGPAFFHRFAGAPEVQLRKVAEPPMDRPKVVERRTAAKVVSLDERHRQAALCRVVRDRQAVNTASHDEEVERPSSKSVEITNHSVGW